MSSDPLSLIFWYRQDAQSDMIQARITRVDTGESIHIRENTFFLRINTLTLDESSVIKRCAIRHIASGREAHIQSGSQLCAFIYDCVLQSQEPPPEAAPECLKNDETIQKRIHNH